MPKDQTDKQTVIVIGAGANADFRLRNAQDLIAEIRPENGFQRVTKPSLSSDNKSVAMPTGEQLVRKIANEDELMKLVCFQYFEKFIRSIAKLDDSKLNQYTDLMCHFFDSIEQSWLTKPQQSHDHLFNGSLFFQKHNAAYSGNQQMLEIGRFIFALLERIPNEIRKSGIKAIRQSIVDLIKNEFSHYFELSDIVRSNQPFSIDELLNSIENEKVFTTKQGSWNSRKELVEAGKVLIANYLLKAETEKTFQDFESICWYRHLRNMIVTCGGNYAEVSDKIDQLTIISFNYDRSLDYFLRTKLSPFYEKLKERIIYPYGNLLKTESSDDSFLEISYGYLKEEKSLSDYHKKGKIFEVAERMHRSLQIIGEIQDSEKERIRSVINRANKLYFLGFSFNRENCDVLGLFDDNFKTNKPINFQGYGNFVYYTNFNNSKRIEEKFMRIFGDLSRAGRTKTSDKGTYDALAEDFDLQFSR